MTRPRTTLLEALAVATAGVIGSALILTASARIGGTFDELFYLDAGLEHWRTGSNFRLLAAGTMPLPVDVVTLPVHVCERLCGEPWAIHKEFLALLKIARLPTLAFWWLLILFGWRIARDAGGPMVGWIAAVFLCLEPNLLAHAGLATTDVAFTACLLLFAHLYARGRGQSWFRRIILPSLACGLAFSAKASAMLFVPIVVTAIECAPILERSPPWHDTPIHRGIADIMRQRSFWRDACCVYLLGVGLAYVYCGSDWRAHPKIIAAASNLPPGRCRDLCLWLAENLRIFNNAGVAFWYQIQHNLRGHGSYILGLSLIH
ncbi:MAG: glycosyltransferase family 39 protein, partial [Gemmataceae bacterium]|nr:glycosyltransferase family 39 protein [Gemmataceae bacterium]